MLDDDSSQDSFRQLDAQTIYGKIRESTSSQEFQKFAGIINQFNSQQITVSETMEKVEEIVKDQDLIEQMRTLVYKAMDELKF